MFNPDISCLVRLRGESVSHWLEGQKGEGFPVIFSETSVGSAAVSPAEDIHAEQHVLRAVCGNDSRAQKIRRSCLPWVCLKWPLRAPGNLKKTQRGS